MPVCLHALCVFLEALGIMEAFEQMRVPEATQMLVPTVHWLLLYVLNVLFGSRSMIRAISTR
jgi:hypothetical protein